MGQVYRARDTRLERDVAIKILPEAFAHDADRLARFQREAKTLASLNHPNIAIIHGLEQAPSALRGSSGQAGDVHALVMELVEGDDLSQRIARGAIPIDEALPIARQIAEALEAAHEHGVIHRDLKPANIKVRSDGTVKVLDFGLAKALEPVGALASSASMAPTITTPAMMTGVGMILGTAAYMSPEQARGKPVDRRTDIWAFGCVLYEMLTGRRAFEAEDVSMTLSMVLQREPDFAALPLTVPARVTQALRVCLRKDPKQRAGDIRDVRLALEGAFETAAPQTMAPAALPDQRWTRAAAFRLAAAAAVVAALVTGGGVWMLSRSTPEAAAPVARLAITLPDDQRFADLENPALAVSPQGTLVAYAAQSGDRQQLHVRAIDGVESKALAGTEGATNPFFSPDGKWIGFFAQGKVKKISVEAGTTQTLCDAPNARGGSWAGGEIYFAATGGSGLSKVSADGGTPTAVTTLDRSKGDVSHRWPHALPGGGG